ncbi:hypothetical protein SYNPS1DRAFT_25674 [Syncephalis pseudoplumigaleata]|uniref:Ribosome assembly protein 3 n=1 Tax=Syncephalis pseudoplumigaleata TaxID=1712513 RepID=A0A4P9YRP8_9FUNG|nr:hypothetical protein SYNPS1DRAFT_25674 [Syncephalis pseudoplumigaleata]|eukprot:RKP22546.1 hypothetical protein SYNPS1DRAFT_25674 [Syncephalis pseudoplumigaleata]
MADALEKATTSSDGAAASIDEQWIRSSLQELEEINDALDKGREEGAAEKRSFARQVVLKNNPDSSAVEPTSPQSYRLIALRQEIDRVAARMEDCLHRQASAEKTEQASSQRDATNELFRDYYMATLTDTFGDDLEQLRQQEALDEHRLALLIDALEAGQDTFTDLAKQLTVNSA